MSTEVQSVCSRMWKGVVGCRVWGGAIYSGSGRQRSDQFEPSVWPPTTTTIHKHTIQKCVDYDLRIATKQLCPFFGLGHMCSISLKCMI